MTLLDVVVAGGVVLSLSLVVVVNALSPLRARRCVLSMRDAARATPPATPVAVRRTLRWRRVGT